MWKINLGLIAGSILSSRYVIYRCKDCFPSREEVLEFTIKKRNELIKSNKLK